MADNGHITEADIIKYIDGELSEKESEKIKRHLTICEPCNQKFAAYSSVNEILDDYDIPIHTLPELSIELNMSKQRMNRWKYIFNAACVTILIAVSIYAGIITGNKVNVVIKGNSERNEFNEMMHMYANKERISLERK